MGSKIFLELTPEQVEAIQGAKLSRTDENPMSYSIKGAAEKLGVSVSTMHRMINNGHILKTVIGKSPRIMNSEIEKFTSR